MKAAMLFTGGGPLVMLTERDSIDHPDVLNGLRAKGVTKFIGHELPLEEVRSRYGHHYEAVVGDLRQTDALRVLDADGHHAFQLFSLSGLGPAVIYEGTSSNVAA